MVCVCWLVVCSTLEVGISDVDEVISGVLCCVVVDGENGEVPIVDNGEVPIVDNVVSIVEPLSSVDDSNVDMIVGVITVVNVD